MSGPKSSSIVLSPEALAELERQRVAAERKRIAQKKYADCIKEFDSVRQELAGKLEAIEQGPANDENVRASSGIIRDSIEKITNLCNLPKPDETNAINQHIDDMRVSITEIISNLNQAMTSINVLEVHNGLSQRFSAFYKKEYLPLKNISFAEVNDVANLAAEQAQELINKSNITKADKQQIETLYSQLLEICDAGDVTISEKNARLQQHIQNLEFFMQIAENNLARFNAIYQEYAVGCAASGVKCMPEKHFTSAEHISAELTKVKEIERKRLAQNFIRVKIDEVMREFQYDVIHSDLLNPLTNGTRELYKMDNESAISAYISDSGTIMLEVVAIGDETNLTENEKTYMVRKQNEFCNLHPKIAEALKKKGVILSEIKYQPPHKDFVRKVAITRGKNTRQAGKDQKERVIGKDALNAD